MNECKHELDSSFSNGYCKHCGISYVAWLEQENAELKKEVAKYQKMFDRLQKHKMALVKNALGVEG